MYKKVLVPVDLADTDLAKPAITTAIEMVRTSGGSIRLVNVLAMRFDALQARASASEKLLGDAREHLLARADEIRIYDRRAGELAMERDALQARIADLETERMQRESQFTEVDQARATLMGTPKGRTAGAEYLRAFVEDVKASGFVADAIKRANQSASVAPPAAK